MSNIRDFYYLQKCTHGELNDAFEQLEIADRNQSVDLGLTGISTGMSLAQHGAGDLTVDVTGLGAAYDPAGQRIAIPSQQNLNVAVDSNNVTTAVTTPGNSKIVSVFVQFDRALSDPRIDGNSLTVFFVRDETFKFKVVQGSEAPSPSPPALLSDGLLLGDITRTFGVNVILTAAIDLTHRRQDAFVVAGSPFSLRRGRALDAIGDIVTRYNQHVTGLADPIAATGVAYAGGGAWRNGDTNPASNAEAQFDKMVSDLASASTGSSGTEHIGAAAVVGALGTITAGTLLSQLQALKLAQTIEYAGGGAWADSSTNPAASVEAQLDKMISDLSSTTGSGADKIGIKARTAWLGGRTNAASTLFAAVDKIITDLASTTTSDDGAERIGLQALPNWLGGRTNPAADVAAGMAKIINDLNAQTSADDGASRIGAETGLAGFIAGSVRGQLDQIGPGGPTTYTGTKTFSDFNLSGTARVKLGSRTLFRTAGQFPVPQGDALNDWIVTGGIALSQQTTMTGNAKHAVYIAFDIPDGALLGRVDVYIKGAGSSGRAAPTTRAQMSVRIWDITTNTTVYNNSTVDASSMATYTAGTSLFIAGINTVVDRTKQRVAITFVGEGGANFIAGLQVIGATAAFTITSMDDAAG